MAKPTSEELSKISSTALQVGKDFGFSAIEVAGGMEAMSKQGLSVQEVIAGIGGVAAAAAADGSSLEETMGGLLATMAGMGAKATDLQHIADVMAKAGDATAASIGTLSQSMSVFGPTAKALGIPLESAIGQLALLQDAGIDASSAGTTLSAVYSKLASPVEGTAKALKSLGISVADSYGNLKPPEQLMNEIFSATQKIEGSVGKAAAITELVGLNSQKALLNISAAVGSGKFSKVMGDLTSNVDGYSTAIARMKQDSAAGSIQKMTASFEALRISIFGIVSKDLRELIDKTTAWASANEGLITAKFKDSIAWLKDNLPTIALWTQRIGYGVAGIVALAAAVKLVRGALLLTQGVLWAVTTATTAYALATGAATATEQTSTAAIVLGTAAKWARNAATWAVQAATWAYNAAVTASALLTKDLTVAEVAGTVAKWARNAVTWVVSASQWAYNAALGAGTVAAGGLTAAIVAGSTAFLAAAAPIMPLIAAVGLLAAGVIALKTAWDGLMGSLGGADKLMGTIGKMWEMGTLDVAMANDAYLNEEAGMSSGRANSEAAAASMSAAELAASNVHPPTRTVSESYGEVTIKDQTGKAAVTQKPNGPGLKLNLQPTGTY